MLYFNSRPSARGDSIFQDGQEPAQRISIHAPPRGATSPSPTFSIAEIFQFTPLREGRPPTLGVNWWELIFQFTPLREGRRDIAMLHNARQIISIHAPPRGATECVLKDNTSVIDFNSRPSARGDVHTLRMGRENEKISIHAPPRGATWCYIPLAAINQHFNSRPSARGDE